MTWSAIDRSSSGVVEPSASINVKLTHYRCGPGSRGSPSGTRAVIGFAGFTRVWTGQVIRGMEHRVAVVVVKNLVLPTAGQIVNVRHYAAADLNLYDLHHRRLPSLVSRGYWCQRPARETGALAWGKLGCGGAAHRLHVVQMDDAGCGGR